MEHVDTEWVERCHIDVQSQVKFTAVYQVRFRQVSATGKILPLSGLKILLYDDLCSLNSHSSRVINVNYQVNFSYFPEG